MSGIISLRDEMLAELERLRIIMRGDNIEETEDYKSLSDEEKEIFNKFLMFFSVCPVCKRENHKSYLLKFYFDATPDSIMLKKRLLKFIEESKEFEGLFYNKIILGIPCCNCFELVFNKKFIEF